MLMWFSGLYITREYWGILNTILVCIKLRYFKQIYFIPCSNFAGSVAMKFLHAQKKKLSGWYFRYKDQKTFVKTQRGNLKIGFVKNTSF